MEQKKSYRETARVHRALIEQARQFREARARRVTIPQADEAWSCTRGHAWDETLSNAQNVRCMNCASQRREMQMRRLREIAEWRGGALLSTNAAHAADPAAPLRWRCAFGHVWEAGAQAIDREWCRECVREGVYDGECAAAADETERQTASR